MWYPKLLKNYLQGMIISAKRSTTHHVLPTQKVIPPPLVKENIIHQNTPLLIHPQIQTFPPRIDAKTG